MIILVGYKSVFLVHFNRFQTYPMAHLEHCVRDDAVTTADIMLELVTARSRSGASALHLTIVGRESEDMVSELISLGADVNATNMFGETPIFWAVQKGQTAIIKLLVAHGANLNAIDSGKEFSLN
jgi:ankyrin repeat protein